MWLLVFLISLFCVCTTAQAQDLPRLHNWTLEHPNWKEEKAELGFVASRCATMRATMSFAPPGGKGTIMRTGRSG